MIRDGVDAIFGALLATVSAALITVISNAGFHQHWNFFIVWLFCFIIAFGGFVIFDDDNDWDIW